jgi:hypothetical protein
MPQLAKGGKWVFGWTIVSPTGEISIPPEAYIEYGFQPGETVVFLPGSRRSRGFGIGKQEKLAGSVLQTRLVGQAMIDPNGKVAIPVAIGVQPGERLLVVRGSGLALGFLQCGPIYEEAQKHREIETFTL